MQLSAFRAEARAWLDTNCPESMRLPAVQDEVVWGDVTLSLRTQIAKFGWNAWPEKVGPVQRGLKNLVVEV